MIEYKCSQLNLRIDHMSDCPTVTIIVLNYNGLTHLKDCFSSLKKIDYPDELLELMLVDNASTDGSVEYIQSHYPQVSLVRNQQNLGFGSGNNIGAREATGQYVVFLNNDMWVEPQFLRGFVKVVQSDPDAVCAGAKILNWDGTRFDFAGSASHFAGYAYQEGMDKPFMPDQFTSIKPMLLACGGAMLISRQVFLEVGGFDDDYFMFYEDSDLGWRLWLMGYKVVFAPDAIVHHRHHGSASNLSNYRKQVLYKRNALYSVIKNYDDENLGRVLPAVLLATVSGVVKQAIQSGQLDKDDYYIKSQKEPTDAYISFDKQNISTLVAIQDVVSHLPQLMEKRRFVQGNRRRSDKEVAKMFRWPFRYWPDVDTQTQYTVADAFDVQRLFEDIPRRVLVISSDILPYPGMPRVESGLRAWGLGEGLRSRGHEVIFASAQAAVTGHEEIVTPEVTQLAWEPEKLLAVVDAAEPDIVVVCNWTILDQLPTHLLVIPVILDQHEPHLLEREYQNFGVPDENVQSKLRALRKADFFTCGGEKQLKYFESWLERAGWTERERRERAAAIPLTWDRTIDLIDGFIRRPSMRHSKYLVSIPQAELDRLQSQLQQTQADLERSASQLQNTQAELERSASQLQQTQAELERSQSQIAQNKGELERSQERIKAMESSKFWKLRKAWFRLKRIIGLPEDE